MDTDYQRLIVDIVVAVACIWLGRYGWKKYKKRASSKCGSSCGCDV